MPIDPEEITGKRFVVSLRGYDRGEVEAFLRVVAAEQARLLARVAELEQAVASGTRTAKPDRRAQELATTLDAAALSVAALHRELLDAVGAGAGTGCVPSDEAGCAPSDEAGYAPSDGVPDTPSTEPMMSTPGT